MSQKKTARPRIVYTINPTVSWSEVCWVDLQGQKHNETVEGAKDHPYDVAYVHATFEKQHPGAYYLSPDGLAQYLEQIAADRRRIAAWNEGKAI